MDVNRVYQEWLSSPKVDEESKKELLAMDEATKADAFYKDIAFGTAGMRGLLGPGLNRINVFTVAKVSIGLGLYVLRQGEEGAKKGIVISHDNRTMSREFTLLAADIFSKMGIKAYIFDALRPTPELSFAVRYARAAAGVMITASHNSKEYNGYKVYDEKGCQMVPDKIQPLLDILASLPGPLAVEIPLAEKQGEIVTFGPEVDDEYLSLVKTCQVHPELDKKGFKIIYSPQHGASYENALRVFQELGYEIIPVKEQCVHDPFFGATKTPNPEKAEAWELSLEYAKRHHADLCLMTDPDGDRCGLAYLSSKGTYERLTGNQSGALLIDYVLGEKKAMGLLPENAVIYDTIVTSTLGEEVAAHYGVKCESFLTGFKFIGDRISHYEDLGVGPTFVFGYEESYGCLLAPFVRDKDGVQAILLYAEMALFYHRKGIPLDIAYENLQKRFGFHYAETQEKVFAGVEGAMKMKELMERLHKEPIWSIHGVAVNEIRDYQKDITLFPDGRQAAIENLPPSDVVKYVLEDRSTLTVRPSGTEPKVKFYVEAVGKDEAGLKEKAQAYYRALMEVLGI